MKTRLLYVKFNIFMLKLYYSGIYYLLSSVTLEIQYMCKVVWFRQISDTKCSGVSTHSATVSAHQLLVCDLLDGYYREFCEKQHFCTLPLDHPLYPDAQNKANIQSIPYFREQRSNICNNFFCFFKYILYSSFRMTCHHPLFLIDLMQFYSVDTCCVLFFLSCSDIELQL